MILVASRNRENFRLNKFLVAIMQHIAVCDISVSIVMILPTAVSLIADAWVLGDVLCCVQPYISYYFYSVNLSLICVLTAGKFMLLRKPVQAKNMSKKRAHTICGMIWMLFLLNPVLLYTLGKDDSSFDYRLYLCAYGFNSYTWKKILPLVSVINFIIPNSVMIATTIPTLKYLFEARKSAIRNKKSVPWQGALTVFLTAIVYLLTTLPIGAYFLVHSFVNIETYAFHLFFRYGTFLTMANVSSNFFIYSLTHGCKKRGGRGGQSPPRILLGGISIRIPPLSLLQNFPILREISAQNQSNEADMRYPISKLRCLPYYKQ